MNWTNWSNQDWSDWKSQWRSTRRLKHAKVKGQPVAGTGKWKRRKHTNCRCDWCVPASGQTRTAVERDASKFEQEAN
jgi:hypothetical protein